MIRPTFFNFSAKPFEMESMYSDSNSVWIPWQRKSSDVRLPLLLKLCLRRNLEHDQARVESDLFQSKLIKKISLSLICHPQAYLFVYKLSPIHKRLRFSLENHESVSIFFLFSFLFKQILRSNLAFIFEGLVYFEAIWFDQKRGFSSKSAWVFQGVRRKINVSPYQCHVLRKRQGVCLLRTHGTSCVILYSYQFAISLEFILLKCVDDRVDGCWLSDSESLQ